MEVVKYKLVTAKTPNGLTYNVNSFIEEGWQPVGGVALVTSEGAMGQRHITELMQSMVKYHNEMCNHSFQLVQKTDSVFAKECVKCGEPPVEAIDRTGNKK